jgi:hypothetical protein
VTINRRVLLAFLVAGAFWITGVCLGLRGIHPVIVPTAAYVVFGSLALAARQGRTGQTLGVLWAVPVGMLWAWTSLVDPGSWHPLRFGLAYGTLLFAIWIGTGFLFLYFLVLGRRHNRAV